MNTEIGYLLDVLQAYSTNQGITQEALARELGVSQMTVSRWLSGKGAPSSKPVINSLKRFLESEGLI